MPHVVTRVFVTHAPKDCAIFRWMLPPRRTARRRTTDGNQMKQCPARRPPNSGTQYLFSPLSGSKVCESLPEIGIVSPN